MAMAGISRWNATESPNSSKNDSMVDYYGSHNGSMYDYYDMYGLWPQEGYIQKSLIALLVVGGILLLVDLVLLLSCISREARSRSASWYLYHMIGLSVISGVLVIPLEYSANVCRIRLFFSHVIACVRGMNLILINIEIMMTVLAPQAFWERNRKCRFFISVLCIWLFNAALVNVILEVGQVYYGVDANDCYIYGTTEHFVLHALKNWLPGLVLICFTIAAIVKYCRWHKNGTYNQIQGNSDETVQYRQWFICLVVLNSLYFVLSILVYELHMLIMYHWVLETVILASTNLVVFLIPLSILALKEVRMALKRGAVSAWTYVCKRQERPPLPSTENDQNISLNMDTIDDQSL